MPAAVAAALAAAAAQPTRGGVPAEYPRPPRPRHHRQDRAAAEEVRGRRRRDRRLRRLRGARPSPRLAGRRSSRRDDAAPAPSARCPRDKYYIPGSILKVAVDNTNPLAYGFEKQVDVMFDNSPVMHLGPSAAMNGVRPVAWFAGKDSLRSGWAWGQHYLEDGVAAAEARSARARCSCSDRRSPSARSRTARSSSCSTAIYYGTSVPATAGTTTTTAAQQ